MDQEREACLFPGTETSWGMEPFGSAGTGLVWVDGAREQTPFLEPTTQNKFKILMIISFQNYKIKSLNYLKYEKKKYPNTN